MMQVLLAVLVAALLSQLESPAESRPMVDAAGLRSWTAGRMKPECVQNTSGIVSVAECAGWMRTAAFIFGDYEHRQF